jgi:hypothetical protein
MVTCSRAATMAASWRQRSGRFWRGDPTGNNKRPPKRKRPRPSASHQPLHFHLKSCASRNRSPVARLHQRLKEIPATRQASSACLSRYAAVRSRLSACCRRTRALATLTVISSPRLSIDARARDFDGAVSVAVISRLHCRAGVTVSDCCGKPGAGSPRYRRYHEPSPSEPTMESS